MTKIVVDSNVYISAIFWGGNPRKLIDLGREQACYIFISRDIKREICEKLEQKFHLEPEDIERIFTDLSFFTIPVHVTVKIDAVPNDPDDNKFLECAVSCRADYIVSGDKHLLSLKEYQGIKIMKVSEFLQYFHKN